MTECGHWQEIEAQAADRKFDGGEFSGPRQKEPTSPMCGTCEMCLEYAAELEKLPPDVIHCYTRAQAINDGILVSLAKDVNPELAQLCEEAGFIVPVAMTIEVFAQCVELTAAAKRAHNDIKGRLWDILTMMRHAMRREQSDVNFKVLVVRDRVRPTLTQLRGVIGPGDNGEPVITIMFPGQD